MARHYATKDYFQHMPYALLAHFFQEKTVFRNLDFAAMSETQYDELFAAWLALPEARRNTMDAEFRDIFDPVAKKVAAQFWTKRNRIWRKTSTRMPLTPLPKCWPR